MINSIDRVLIVGFGSMGKRYSKLIHKHFPQIELKILRHFKPADGLAAENDFLFTIEDALLFEPNIAIVANPASLHLDISKVLAEHKVHLLIEKPITSNSKGVADFLIFCENLGITVMTGYNLRFLSSLIEFKRLLKKKEVGKILKVHSEVGQYLPSWRESDYKNSVSAQMKLGGGALLELSHEIDYLSWIFGRITWVKSHLSRQSNLEIDVEDTVNVIFGFKKVSGFQLIGSLKMDFIRHDKTRFCEVIGEKGTLIWNGITGEIKCFLKNESEWKVLLNEPPAKEDTYLKEIKHFFSAVTKNNAPLISGKDGLNAILIVEAIHKSNNINGIVYL